MDGNGWSAEATACVARAIERHGGLERWRDLRLSLSLTSLRGLLPWMKGLGRTFPRPARVEVVPSRALAVFADYPGPGMRTRFARGAMAVDDGTQAQHRATFDGPRKRRRWTPLDAAYFFGYALTHYHALPFTLPEAQLLRWDARRRAVTVAFPETVHTHSRVQTIYFAADGLIVRHDYVADVIGGWARGAHYWRDYVTVEGFPVATHRRVLARIGRVPMPLVALEGRFAPPEAALDGQGVAL